MGKNYYCDYCDKSFKGGINIRQKHINGLAHQTIKKAHYAKYFDPKLILEAELRKKLCKYNQQGCCQFGDSCHFSHFTPNQIAELQEQVRRNEYKEWLKSQPKQYSTDLIAEFLKKRQQKRKSELQATAKQFWKYPEELLQRQEKLPPSLQLLKLEKCTKTVRAWGE